MIVAADFYKWTRVFNLYGGSTPPPAPPGTIYTPISANLSGIASVSALIGFYQGNQSASGGLISVFVGFTVVDDGSGNLMRLTLTNPIAANFTNANQGKGNGGIIKTANLSVPGAVGDGVVHSVLPSTSGNAGMLITLEGASLSTSYYVALNWQYQIQ